MKKLLLLFVTAICAVNSAWAQELGNRGRGWLENISYNWEKNTLTFTDLYSDKNEYRRQYLVEIYDPQGNSVVEALEEGTNERKITQFTFGRYPNFYKQTIDLGSLMWACYKEGVSKVRIYISGVYIIPMAANNPDVGMPTWYPDMPGKVKNYIDAYINPLLVDNDRKVAWGMSEDDYSVVESNSIDVDYGDDLRLSVVGRAMNDFDYSWERSQDGGKTWQTCPNYVSGSERFCQHVSTVEGRKGKQLIFKYPVKKGEKPSLFRAYLADQRNGAYSDVMAVNFRYPCTMTDGNTNMCKADSVLVLDKPKDCHEYRYTSELPVKVEEDGDYLYVTMPACPLTIEEYVPTYQVDFYDSDATLLKSEEVEAGKDATPPDMGNGAPALAGMRRTPSGSFKGWDKDYTNVRQRLNVFAKREVYVDMDIDMASHTCNRTDDWKFQSWFGTKFEGNKQKAMLGDLLTFRASVKTNTPVNVYFQTGTVVGNDISWGTATKVGEVTGYDVNKTMTFDKEVTALVDYYNEMALEKKRYYRFYAVGSGTAERVYSPMMEVEMYYPLTVVADQELQVVTNEGGFYFNAERSVIPVQYGEKVVLLDRQGFKGAGLDVARVNKPGNGYLTEGTDENGNRYILGPGERETLNVTTQKLTVVFEVPGQGKEEFKKYGSSAYDVQTVPYGHSAKLPEQPAQENSLFLGWQSWNSSEYPDDGYLYVTQDLMGFTAQFEYIPPVTTYTVTFQNWDGTVLSTQQVEEGQNAEAPTVPERSGYHFSGWDTDYVTVTQNLTVTALYGKDEVYYTITYKDYDGTDLGTEQVLEGEAASGLAPTREHYTFTHWRDYTTGEEAKLDAVTANQTVEAVYTETLWTLTYRVDGVQTYSIQVVDGYNPAAVYYPHGTPTKASTVSTDYTFTGWTPGNITSMTEDLTFDAVFAESPHKYTVTFQNWDHSLLETQAVAYGTAATAPAAPSKSEYTFTGWDRDFSSILADMTVTATFVRTDLLADAISEVQTEESATTTGRARKVLVDGQLLLITSSGQVFNTQGVEVK